MDLWELMPYQPLGFNNGHFGYSWTKSTNECLLVRKNLSLTSNSAISQDGMQNNTFTCINFFFRSFSTCAILVRGGSENGTHCVVFYSNQFISVFTGPTHPTSAGESCDAYLSAVADVKNIKLMELPVAHVAGAVQRFWICPGPTPVIYLVVCPTVPHIELSFFFLIWCSLPILVSCEY